MSKPTKKVKYPIHKMGKHYGYEEFEDGSIQIAPSLSQIIDNLQNREEAIRRILNFVTRECNEAMAQIVEESKKFWDTVEREYELDVENKIYSYYRRDKKITGVPRGDDKELAP